MGTAAGVLSASAAPAADADRYRYKYLIAIAVTRITGIGYSNLTRGSTSVYDKSVSNRPRI